MLIYSSRGTGHFSTADTDFLSLINDQISSEMCYSRCLSLLWLVLLLTNLYSQAMDGTCPKGWFGHTCRNKCHCPGELCNSDGDCLDGNQCVSPWFGPACQYLDLLSDDKMVPAFLRDHDDSTCNDQSGPSMLLPTKVFTEYQRIVARDSKSVKNIQVEYGDGILCEKMVSIPINSVTRDIYCSNRQFVEGLTLKGDGVRNVCSLYVSVGRNVALKQHTWQTGTYENSVGLYGPQNGVDGRISTDLYSGFCIHTNTHANDPVANWSLTFDQEAYFVNRLVLYNRGDKGYGERIRSALLQVFDFNLELLYSYTFSDHEFQAVYTWDIPLKRAVKRIDVLGRNKHRESKHVLHFCEFEVYGETACGPTKYGFECEYRCSQCIDRICPVNDVACFTCTQGRKGINCEQLCHNGTYGENCAKECHPNCVDNDCDGESGTCTHCVTGFQGSHCDSQCSMGYFGYVCNQRCSRTCNNNLCDHVDGTCLSCVPGYTGDFCQHRCDTGTFGIGCKEKCSTTCETNNCSHTTGFCFGCKPGYSGSYCDTIILYSSDMPLLFIMVPVLLLTGCLLLLIKKIRTEYDFSEE